MAKRKPASAEDLRAAILNGLFLSSGETANAQADKIADMLRAAGLIVVKKVGLVKGEE